MLIVRKCNSCTTEFAKIPGDEAIVGKWPKKIESKHELQTQINRSKWDGFPFFEKRVETIGTHQAEIAISDGCHGVKQKRVEIEIAPYYGLIRFTGK